MSMDPIERIVSVAFGGAAGLTYAEKQEMIRQLREHVAEQVAASEQSAQHARDNAVRLSAETEQLRRALRDIASMVQQFDTPRDAGRVRAFVGDVGQVARKGLGESR